MKKFIPVLLLAMVMWGLDAPPAHAAYTRGGETVIIDEQTVIEDDVYAGGQVLTIRGNINGDVFCGGQTVNIEANIDGDVLCGGQKVRISGIVTGDVRVGGQIIDIDAQVGRNITAAGQQLTFGSDASVSRSLTAAGQLLTIDGQVGRDLYGAGQSIVLTSMVGRNVEVEVESLEIARSAVILGNLKYTSEQDARIDQSAAISGAVERKQPEYPSQADVRRMERPDFAEWSGRVLFAFMSTLALAGAFALLLPRFTRKAALVMHDQWLPSLGVGLLVLFGGAVLPLLILFSVIGFKVSIVMWLWWVAELLVAPAIAGLAFGYLLSRYALPESTKRLRYYLPIGVFFYVLLSKLPYLGGLVSFIGLIWGLGGLWLAFWQLRQHKL